MMRDSRLLLTICGMAALIMPGRAIAGDLTAPNGPIVPTMKTLEQIEPRTPVQDLPGDVEAVHVISEPGSYYLLGDIVGGLNLNGIEVRASGVTIDLNGYTLDGGGAGSLNGIAFIDPEVGVFGGIQIKNGEIRSWGKSGVDLGTARSNIISDLVVKQCGEEGVKAEKSIVRRCLLEANGFNGTNLDASIVAECIGFDNVGVGIGAAGLVRNSLAQNNQGDGIFSFGGIIASCEANLSGDQSNFGSGIDLQGPGIVVGCTTEGNSSRGIATGGNTFPGFPAVVDSCSSASEGFTGIIAQFRASLVTDCVVASAGGNAFELRNALAVGNIGVDSDQDGFLIGDRCLLRDNEAAGNGANQLISNDGGFNLFGQYSRVQGNRAIRNIDVGFGSISNVFSMVIGNLASGNGTDFETILANQWGPVQNFTGGGPITNQTATDNIRY